MSPIIKLNLLLLIGHQDLPTRKKCHSTSNEAWKKRDYYREDKGVIRAQIQIERLVCDVTPLHATRHSGNIFTFSAVQKGLIEKVKHPSLNDSNLLPVEKFFAFVEEEWNNKVSLVSTAAIQPAYTLSARPPYLNYRWSFFFSKMPFSIIINYSSITEIFQSAWKSEK